MDLNARLYIEIDIICLMILTIMCYKSMINLDKRKQQRLFIATILSIMIFVGLDLIWIVMDTLITDVPVAAAVIINTGYFVMSGVIVCLWFFYSENVQDSRIAREWKYKLCGLIPFFIHTILVLLSGKTGHVFQIQPDGSYERGELFLLEQFLVFGAVTFTSAKALYKASQKKNYARKKEYQVLALFAATPFVLGLIQIGLEGMPITGVGMTLGILLVYANFQELKISQDALTGLNNRNYMMKLLSYKISHPEEGRMQSLLMIDVNEFKKINDTYGHVEGDRALIRIAEALRIVCGRWESTAIRYGGDEFIMIYGAESQAEVERLCQEIYDELKISNKKAAKPYDLTVSIGYAIYSKKNRFIPDLISVADRELYKAKYEYKKGRGA